jgi:enterochelin esterase-like enzyme
MPGGPKTSRAQVWADNLGDWSWPGQAAAAAVEALPPAWVPSRPPRFEAAGPASAAQPLSRGRIWAWRLLIGSLLALLAAVSAALVLRGHAPAPTLPAKHAVTAPAIDAITNPPALKAVSRDAAGSDIKLASYTSTALRGGGSFYVYEPPGYAAAVAHGMRYPVLYLLHGNSQPATAFLKVGLQPTLDRLIGEHLIPPLLAVMVEGGKGADNWRNIDGQNYESYVLEAQEIADRTLPTIPIRAARGIAGDSMGGYGAMNVALGSPQRFGVVESWIGFFNGLEGQLHTDRPIISKLGLHAFLYGAAQDTIADPSENAPFAAQLSAEGAEAQSAVYPGEHSLETVEAHLASMMHFAGRWLMAPREQAKAK